jgi:chemotaxis protein MotB
LRAQVEQDRNTQMFLERKFFKLHEQKDKERIDGDEKIAQLEAQIAEKNATVEEKRRQFEVMEQQNRAARITNISLQAVVEAGKMTREALNKKLSDMEKNVASEKEMRITISAELMEFMTNATETQEATEKRIAYLKDTLSERETRIAVYQDEMDALNNQIDKDKTELLSLKERVPDLHLQLRREQLEAAQRNAQLKRLVREKEMQLGKATVQLIKMREAIEEVIGDRSEMEDQISAIESQRQTNIKQLLTQLDEKIRERDRQLDDAVKEVDKWKALYQDIEGALNLSRNQLKKLETVAAKTRAEKGAVEYRLKDMGATYNSLIDTLRSKLESKEATIKEYRKKLTLTFVDKILFGRAAVKISSEGKRVLQKTGEVFKNIPYGKIRIVGHTDSDPIRSKYRQIYPSNWELSSARAAAVARFFQETIGIDPARMEITGMAFTQPVANNETKEGKAKNRRVEIVVVPNT